MTSQGRNLNSGFTIIEIMIVMGLISVIGLTMATITTDILKSQRKNEVLNEYNSKMNEISQILSGSTACTKLIGNAVSTHTWSNIDSDKGLSIGELTLQGASVAKSDTNYGQLKISSITLRKTDILGTTEISNIPHTVYRLQLSIGTDNANSSLGAVGKRTKNFGIIATVADAAKTLTGCYDESRIADTLEAACKMLGGVVVKDTQTQLARCTALDGVKSEVTHLKEVTEGLPQLYTTVAGIQTDVVNLTQDIATVNTKISTINSQITSLNTQVSSLDARTTNLDARVTNMASQISTIQNQIGNINQDLNDMRNKFNILEARVTGTEADLNNLKLRLSTLELMVSNMQGQIDMHGTSIQNLFSQVGALNGQLASINSFIQKLVGSSCASGYYISGISSSGRAECGADVRVCSLSLYGYNKTDGTGHISISASGCAPGTPVMYTFTIGGVATGPKEIGTVDPQGLYSNGGSEAWCGATPCVFSYTIKIGTVSKSYSFTITDVNDGLPSEVATSEPLYCSDADANKAWIISKYKEYYKRCPEKAGLDYWYNDLVVDGYTQEQVDTSIKSHPLYAPSRFYTNSQWVEYWSEIYCTDSVKYKYVLNSSKCQLR